MILFFLFFSLLEVGFSLININSCGELNISGEVYNLTQDVTFNGTCFDIDNDSLTLNCNGYILNGQNTSSGYGLYISNNDYVNVNNCNIENFYSGIYLGNSDRAVINNTNISDLFNGASRGLILHWADYNTIENLRVVGAMGGGLNSGGIHFMFSADQNNLSNLVLLNNTVGLAMDHGSSNIIRNVVLDGNIDNDFWFDYNAPMSTFCSQDIRNLTDIQGKYHYILNSAQTIDGWTNLSSIIICDGSNSILRNMNLVGSGRGSFIYSISSYDLFFENLTINNYRFGIKTYVSTINASGLDLRNNDYALYTDLTGFRINNSLIYGNSLYDIFHLSGVFLSYNNTLTSSSKVFGSINFNETFGYGVVGNKWLDLNCLNNITRGPFQVCTNPAYVNISAGVVDFAPLYNVPVVSGSSGLSSILPFSSFFSIIFGLFLIGVFGFIFF